MKLEYIVDEETLKAVELQFYNEAVDFHKQRLCASKDNQVANSKKWIISFSTVADDEKAARILSDVHHEITCHKDVIVLTNDSSAYFNRQLFPMINGFERLLRKLLYLTGNVKGDARTREHLKDLESKDLGTIFRLLFNGVMIWNGLVGNKIPALKKNRNTVRRYRNDVMHAHNISYHVYRDARLLFGEINFELQVYVMVVGRDKENIKPWESCYIIIFWGEEPGESVLIDCGVKDFDATMLHFTAYHSVMLELERLKLCS